MKAIVMTCDRYAPFTDHMIEAYERVWPGHPFTFRVPHQAEPDERLRARGDRVEFVPTPSPIRDTVLGLIEGMDDSEWVYWCIDDKYPIELDVDAAEDALALVRETRDDRVAGVSFARMRRLTMAKHLRPDHWIRSPAGERYIRRRHYWQFWLHQFYRVGVIRKVFEAFPGGSFKPIILDDILLYEQSLPAAHRLYVRERNAVIFGESTEGGVMTRNCVESFAAYGMPIPDGFEAGSRVTVIGEMGKKGENPRGPKGLARYLWAVARRRV